MPVRARPRRPEEDPLIDTLDHDAAARDLLRHLRGGQSQRALSRRLGFRSNVAYRWERGLQPIFAHDLFRLARLTGRDVHEAIRQTWSPAAEAVEGLQPGDPELAQRFLATMLEPANVTATAERVGISRHALHRMATGQARVRLGLLLAILDDTLGRALDFLAALVDPDALPTVAPLWRRREVCRQLYVEHPWTNLLPLYLDAAQYRAASRHDPVWLANRIGVSAAEVEHALSVLQDVGAVAWDGTHWVAEALRGVDLGRSPEGYRRSTAYFTQEALRRIDDGHTLTAFRVFGADEDQLQPMSEALLAGFQAAGKHTSDPGSVERVGVMMVHLVPLDGEPFEVGRKVM